MRLITGPPAPDPGPHVRYPHRLRGVYRLVKGAHGPSGHQQWHFTRARELRPGPPCPQRSSGGVASRTSLLPSCAGTARIRCGK
jgi:hypothetical protein